MSASTIVVVALLLVLVVGLVALERGGDGTKELALVATLGAAAAAGRVLFSPLPGVQPVTITCIVTGAALGPRAGLAVGPIAALISNSFLGQGPWTPPQMALWSLAGLSGALLRPLCRRAAGLALVGAAWGIVFGWAMNVWLLAAFGPALSWSAFLLFSGRSVPFDLAHAGGNVVLALTVGPALLRLLSRYALRVRTTVVIAPAGPPARAPAPAGDRAPPPPAPAPPH